MRLRTFIAAMVAALLAIPGIAAADSLRIGTEGAYPPFNQINAEGELVGFDIDIARALCEKMQVECTFVTQDWDGIIPGLLAGKYDIIVASMSITEERKQAVDFTDRYWSNQLRFVAPKGSDFDAEKPSGAIGAQRATISASYLEDNLADQVSIKLYDTQENAYLDLATGRTDAVLADALVSYDWLNSEEGAEFEFVGNAIDINDRIGIAVRKGNEDLVFRLNAAIAAIRADGTYQEINAKYFPFDIY